MNNDRGWTDLDLSRPREEFGSVEVSPVNNSPSYYNSEHYYNSIEQRATIEGSFQEGVHYNKKGVGNKEEESIVEAPPTNNSPSYYNSEHWYNERGSVPLGNNMLFTEPGYKSSEHYYNEGLVFGIGPNINGKKPSELINSGLLTVENIKEEDKQIVYEDIMLGLTNNKDMLSKKIDLIISDKDIVNKIVYNQYHLAVEEMKREEKGFSDLSTANRKFQFLATVKILMEKGYDINGLSFKKGETQIGLAKLISDFRKECAEHKAKKIDDPSWFKTGQASENYDERKVNDPWLYSGTLITEIYVNNPELFEAEYENYKAATKMPIDQMLSYEAFIHYAYGIEVPVKTDNLQKFREARSKQMQQDKDVRKQQLQGLTQEMIETKEGHSLK